MDPAARILRWVVVVLALANSPVALPVSAHPWGFALRTVGGAFFVWPNCGYHLAWVLRWLHLLPQMAPPADPYIVRMGFCGPVYREPGQ